MAKVLKTFLAALLLLQTACGGGSSGNGTLIEGTLTEAGGAAHRVFRHSEGERIDGVRVCAIDQCSTTDDQGQWGFVLDGILPQEILLTIEGHGIDASAVIEIPNGASDVFLDLQHVEGGAVEVGHMTVDGAEVGDHSGHHHG
ncbi:MAG: hypothetical protein J5J00_16825 [Deltaproteobacteria bacterium]|nr:hypothetical protein [Deltaproteobacteria bacterium]